MAHSVRRPFRRLEEMLPQRRWGIAGELVELAHQLRLVGIAAIGGNTGPVALVLPRQAERPVEAHDARKRLRPDAGRVGEFGGEMLATPAQFFGDGGNAGAAAGRDYTV